MRNDTGAERGAKILDELARKRKAREEAFDVGLLRNGRGVLLPCEHNAYLLIREAARYAELHYDDFLSRMRIGTRDWIDVDDLDCLRWLQSTHDVAKFTIGHARNGSRLVAYSRRRDSLHEFVETLPVWDGVPRIEMTFADAWGAVDNTLTRAASKNLFVAMIARALKPGCQVDTLWIFEGPQGTYKSQSMRTLGGEFHAEVSAQVGTTDFMRELRGLWIAEMSELDSLRGREASTVKRLLSAPSDRFVQKYALHAESYPRRAIAVATTNELSSYWQDSTGARRLVPITCGYINVDKIAEMRLQWFAEALHMFRDGVDWWQFPKRIDEEREERQQIDPWEDMLIRYKTSGKMFPPGKDDEGQWTQHTWPKGWIASAEIMRDWLNLDPSHQGPTSGRRLSAVMRRLGYVPWRSGKERERGWVPAEKVRRKGDQAFIVD